MKTLSDTLYDEDYFERGIQSGKSCYEHYRWIPELTIPMAHFIVSHLGLRPGDSVLDYGCAKGYTVRALRLLGIEAYGCDISEYALENIDPDTRPNCWLVNTGLPVPFSMVEWILSKDVLEHMSESDLDKFLIQSLECGQAFHVIPLGDNGKFRIPEYSKDITHRLAKDEQWWIERFESHGWVVDRFSWAMTGIKENWTSRYPKGNGFFILKAGA
jgi:hypothetical protein